MKIDKVKAMNADKIYVLLKMIEMKYYVFFDKKSISLLENFLLGYIIGSGKMWHDRSFYDEGEPSFNEFRYWIQEKPYLIFSPAPNFSTFVLNQVNNDEEKAFDLFFIKLKEFKELKSFL